MKRSHFLNGKVKAEFGNLDQIKMIKEIEESDKAFKEGFIPDIESSFSVVEPCHCGDFKLIFEAKGNDLFCLSNEEAECPKCQRSYVLKKVKRPHWLTEELVDTLIIKFSNT